MEDSKNTNRRKMTVFSTKKESRENNDIDFLLNNTGQSKSRNNISNDITIDFSPKLQQLELNKPRITMNLRQINSLEESGDPGTKYFEKFSNLKIDDLMH